MVVVYEAGAVSPQEIAVGLAGLGPLTFLVGESQHVRRVRPALERLGTVMQWSTDPDEDARRIRAMRPAAVITFSELALSRTALVAAAAGVTGHAPEMVDLLTDKVRQRARLRAAGVDDTPAWPVRAPTDWADAIAHVGLPAVVKPARGGGSRDTFLVREAGEGERLLAGLLARADQGSGPPAYVVESYLQGAPGAALGDYVSVESLCAAGDVRHFAVTGKLPLLPPFREAGQFWPAALTAEERVAVLDLTTRALLALEVRAGLAHTEIKLTASGPRIIEVNGRLGGHVNWLSKDSVGVDLVRMAGLAALGRLDDDQVPVPSSVFFQKHALAPTAPCRLLSVRGAREARRLPGVRGHRTLVALGEPLPGGVGTTELDLLWGRCEAPDELPAAIATVNRALTYELDIGGRALCMTGAELERWEPSAGGACETAQDDDELAALTTRSAIDA